MRLLLVEDDQMIGEAVLDLLRAEHYAVDWVKDGEMAGTALQTAPYDLVLLDLGLPRRDGLSDGHFYRVGGHSPIKANVRVIAATHQNLDTRVKDGLFREDLFHRLNVIRVRLPALRERREDIPLLARHFLQKSARELGVETKRLTEAALKYMSGLDFQGNVRQLENLCHWLTVMAPGQQVDVSDLPGELREATPVSLATDWESALEGEADRMLARGIPDIHGVLSQVFERILIARALAHTGGRRIEAAQALGIGRNTITRKIAELGIDGGKEHAAE